MVCFVCTAGENTARNRNRRMKSRYLVRYPSDGQRGGRGIWCWINIRPGATMNVSGLVSSGAQFDTTFGIR